MRLMKGDTFSFISLILLASIPSSIQFSLWDPLTAVTGAVSSVASGIGDVLTSIIVNRDPNYVKFLLFNSATGGMDEIDINDPESIKGKNFNPLYTTTFMTHGFTPVLESLSVNNVCKYIIEGYQKVNASINLICVDWENLARPRGLIKVFSYPAVVKNVPVVAERVGSFVNYLVKNTGLNVKNLHLIGFSLGAHVSGIAGQNIESTVGEKVARITGLDPASPQFWSNTTHMDERLDDTDADFVEIVHTNIKANGMLLPIGNVDFYPNRGGPVQPACESSFFRVLGLVPELVCSHSEAYVYYAESIYTNIHACPCSFSSIETCDAEWEENNGNCEEPILFGDKCPPSARGVYYLKIVNKADEKTLEAAVIEEKISEAKNENNME